MPITTCVFDAYGTLFDVTAAARAAAQAPDAGALADCWQPLAQYWRDKQLGYSWLRAVSGAHCDFWQVTQDALDWAMEKCALGDDPALRQRLLDLYWTLAAYEEVPQMLAQLKSAGYRAAILSNGSPDMLAGAVASARIGALLDAVLSVETVGIFKPAAPVYDLVGGHFGCSPAEVLFVSSNGWDAACATGYGFQTVWVNRNADPHDRLPWKPAHMLRDLKDIPLIAAGGAA